MLKTVVVREPTEKIMQRLKLTWKCELFRVMKLPHHRYEWIDANSA
jgi:hypothetical protein